MEPYLPILSKHGFSLSFSNETIENGIKIFGTLAHKEGHQKTVNLSLPLDTSGNKNNIQAVGSTLQYGKRYIVGMLLNVVTEGEDDDGNRGAADFINEEQAANISALITEVKANKIFFLKAFKAVSIETIQSSEYERAIKALEKKRNTET